MSKVLAMDPNVNLKWIPECDQEEPEGSQLVITYHVIDARDEAKINDQMIETLTKGKTSKNKYLISSADLKRCELSMVGWVGFNYSEDHPKLAGQAVPFNVSNIGMLPQKIRAEFVDFITGRKEEEAKDDTDLGEAKSE